MGSEMCIRDRVNTGKPSYIIKTTEVGISEIAVPPYDPVVTQPDGTAYIRFNNNFEEIEYTGADSLPNLENKYVIIGVTAEGIANPVPTPKGLMYPQHIQGHMLQNFIDGSNIQRSQLSALYELLGALLGMVIIGLCVYRTPIWLTVPISLSLLGGTAWISVQLYQSKLLLLDATFPIIAMFLIFSQATFNNFYKQYKLRQQIKAQFGTYISCLLYTSPSPRDS